jgi:hypothetical protein
VTAFAVHPYAPIIASGSQGQKIHVQDFEGLELNQIRYHEGFLGQRIGPVSCLAFHPYVHPSPSPLDVSTSHTHALLTHTRHQVPDVFGGGRYGLDPVDLHTRTQQDLLRVE